MRDARGGLNLSCKQTTDIAGKVPLPRPAHSFLTPDTRPYPFRDEALRRWPAAEWLFGEGPFVVLAKCYGALTITLHETRVEAEVDKSLIDSFRCVKVCVKGCVGDHEIVEIVL